MIVKIFKKGDLIKEVNSKDISDEDMSELMYSLEAEKVISINVEFIDERPTLYTVNELLSGSGESEIVKVHSIYIE